MPTRTKDQVASPLRRWRLDRGLFQEEVAALTGYSKSFISLLESGQRRIPSPLERVKFARRLGASVADLFPLED